jgi:predicted nucleic acid-binding protein
LVAATLDEKVRVRLGSQPAVTRTHSLAEVFSTLTGSRLGFRVDLEDAARVIRDLLTELELVELTPTQVMEALSAARACGVRGGRVHDYLHAVTAKTATCALLLTLNGSDFHGLVPDLPIEAP